MTFVDFRNLDRRGFISRASSTSSWEMQPSPVSFKSRLVIEHSIFELRGELRAGTRTAGGPFATGSATLNAACARTLSLACRQSEARLFRSCFKLLRRANMPAPDSEVPVNSDLHRRIAGGPDRGWPQLARQAGVPCFVFRRAGRDAQRLRRRAPAAGPLPLSGTGTVAPTEPALSRGPMSRGPRRHSAAAAA